MWTNSNINLKNVWWNPRMTIYRNLSIKTFVGCFNSLLVNTTIISKRFRYSQQLGCCCQINRKRPAGGYNRWSDIIKKISCSSATTVCMYSFIHTENRVYMVLITIKKYFSPIFFGHFLSSVKLIFVICRQA